MPILRPILSRDSDGRRRRSAVPLAALMLGLLTGLAEAIPVEISDTGVTLTLPEGFEEVALTNLPSDLSRIFVRRVASNEDSEACLMISRIPTNAPPDLLQTGITFEPADAIGRYSEQLNNQHVAIVMSQVITDNTIVVEQSARVPQSANTLLLDLKLRTNDDAATRELMRKIVESVAATPPPSASTDAVGWQGALVYVGLAAVLLVIGIARR